jgi:hypothetical protein
VHIGSGYQGEEQERLGYSVENEKVCFSSDFSFLKRMGHCIEDCYRSTKFWGIKMGDMLQGFCYFSVDEYVILFWFVEIYCITFD